MEGQKLRVGFAVGFLMLAAIWVIALKPKSGGCRVLQPGEAAMVRGGSGTSGGSSASTKVDITLKNIPYITQHLNPKNSNSNTVARSKKYCGIASALMVRAKNEKDAANAPSLYDGWENHNYPTVDTEMKRIDENLLNGYYGYYYNNNRRVDVLTNKGLLYINRNLTSTQQFDETVNILKGVYIGTSGNPLSSRKNLDAISLDKGHVTDVSIWTTSAVGITNSIWTHIEKYHQPAVVVVDGNKQNYDKVLSSSAEPVLHYIVIRGIYQESSGKDRYFFAYDPYSYIDKLKYREQDLQKLIALPDSTPEWVYKYGNPIAGSDPAYILTVQGD
jgi:hypothetical protein